MKIKYNGAIKASSDGNEDIVMYWDGQKVYEGPADSDMTRKIAWFLDDPEKLQEIVDYCNSFGDPVIEDTSDLMDVAATFVEMVGYELREAESIDDDVYVSDEAGHFEIFEKSKEVTGAKKSVKCSTDGNVPYDLVSMLVALRDYVDTSSAYVNDEHNKLVDIADSMYNTGLSIEEMRPEYKTIYDKYGKTFFDKVLKDVSAIDSQLTRNNLNDLIADYEDRANAFIGVESACGSKKSVKAAEQDGNKKFRIDVYKKDNPDALIKREYKTCNSKEEAQKYGQSIADGNTVNVMEVKSSCSKRKSVRAAAVMAGPGAGYTIKWNLESINNINSFNVTNVSEPDEYGLITVEADCDVDVTVEIVEAYSYYYGIDRPINDVAAKMTKVSFEIDPDQWPELGSFYDAGVDFAAEFLNNEIYDTISNGEVMYGGGWSHSTWDGTLTDYEHDGLIEIKVTDEETIEYVDDAVSGELEGAYDDVEESKRINSSCGRKSIKSSDGGWTTDELVDKMNNNYRKHKRNKQQKDAEKFNAFNKKYAKHGIELKPTDDSNYGAYQVINKGTPMDRLDDFRDMEKYADSLIETEEYVNSSRNRFSSSAKTPIKSSDFEFVFDENEEDEYDENDLSGYYSYDELTPEQQDYAVSHWGDFSRCANTIYDWFNEDIMDFYHEDKQRIAEEFNENYGFDIKTDELYWGSSSQGPYPEWDNEKVFGKVWLANAGNLSDVDVSFGGSLTVDTWADYYVGEGDNEHIEYGIGIDELTTYGADEEAVKVISNLADGAQKFIDEIWNSIEETCRAYPDEEWVKGIFEANPSAFTFVVDENGDIEDIT